MLTPEAREVQRRRETESITKMWPQGKYGLNCATHADTHSLSLSFSGLGVFSVVVHSPSLSAFGS